MGDPRYHLGLFLFFVISANICAIIIYIKERKIDEELIFVILMNILIIISYLLIKYIG